MNYSIKTLASIAASIGLINALPATAAVVDDLTAKSSVRIGSYPANIDGPYSGATSVSSNVTVGDLPSFSDGTASSSGNGGLYSVSATGSGVFNSTGQFQHQWAITNDSGIAQKYTLNFLIGSGVLVPDNNFGGGDGYAEYSVNILQNGSTSLFNSSAKIASDGTLTTSGTTLTGAVPFDTSFGQFGASYSWSETYITLDLGILSAGASSSLQFDLIANAFGNYSLDNCSGGYYPGDWRCTTGSSSAFLGASRPISGIGISAQPVPEPGSWAMLVAGLGLVGFAARRRNRS